MRHSYTLIAVGLFASTQAMADVKELGRDEMVGTYVQGISIGQENTDTTFASDEETSREAADDQKSALLPTAPSVSVTNASALQAPPPSVDHLVAAIHDQQTRDLVEDTISQTSLSTRLDINFDRATAESGVPVVPPGNANSSRDFNVLRGSILELLPSATGYQMEFMKDRY